MALDTDFQNLAKDLIGNVFGDLSKKAVLTRTTTGGLSGSSFSVTETSQNITVILSTFKSSRESREPIQMGDLKCLVAAKGVTKPDTNDALTIGGQSYNILDIQVDAADAMYVMHVRGC